MRNATFMRPETAAFAGMFDPICVLFTMEQEDGELAYISGVMRLERETLRMEFLVRDNVFGQIHSKLRHIELPLEAIDRIVLIKGWFSSMLVLTVGYVGLLDALAPSDPCRVELTIAACDRSVAEELINRVKFQQSELRVQAAMKK